MPRRAARYTVGVPVPLDPVQAEQLLRYRHVNRGLLGGGPDDALRIHFNPRIMGELAAGLVWAGFVAVIVVGWVVMTGGQIP